MSDKFSELKSKIKDYKDKNQKLKKADSTKDNYNAFSLATEFVSIFLVATLLGLYLDKVFGTHPWMIMILFLLGMVTFAYKVKQLIDKS